MTVAKISLHCILKYILKYLAESHRWIVNVYGKANDFMTSHIIYDFLVSTSGQCGLQLIHRLLGNQAFMTHVELV